MKTKREQTINVKAVRETTGLNQTDFWKRIGVTQSGGSRYETGRAMPKPVELLFKLTYAMSFSEALETFEALRSN